ncbi:MAG: RNA methyltransferase [Planctomycetes bacterium]|nr:RNA methyltransferase [Planctomycetota bacterium]
METITSLQNPRVKNAVKLRDRRGREKQHRFLIEGYREVRRAVESGLRLDELFTCSALYLGANEPALVDRAQNLCGAQILPVNADVFQKLSYRDRPDGLLATAAIPHWRIADWPVVDTPLYVIAVAIEKPGNLGTILRTADAVGAHGVIVCDHCTDVFNPNVVRASVGTLFTVPVAETPSHHLREWLDDRGVSIVATTPSSSLAYTDVDLRQGVGILVGSEQYGLPSDWLEAATHRVSIPMAGDADSLNAAVATAVVLFEVVRQRRS